MFNRIGGLGCIYKFFSANWANMIICLILKEEKVPSSCASLLTRLQDLACHVRDQAVAL